jgi:pyruvate dehydrogenase E2 component (dihydrolipoamide acetyltransferase)
MSRETALFDFHFPDIGEGLTEGTIVEIKVSAGKQVKQGETLAIVETDKVVTEMPSPVEGLIVELPIVKGQVVHVGEIVARIRTSAAPAPAVAPAAQGAAGHGVTPHGETQHGAAADRVHAHVSESGSVVGHLDTGSGGVLPASSEGLAMPPRSDDSGAASAPNAYPHAPEALGTGGNGKAPAAEGGTRAVRASPVARKLAAEAGIDLGGVAGTGPGGRVLKKDLAARAPGSPAAPHGPGVRKLSTMRLAIATAMEKSQAIPAAAVHDYTEVDDLLQIRRDMNESSADKVGLLAFFVKAAAHALQEFPLMSSLYSPEHKEYESFPTPHLGVAVDTEEGLVVPVVRDPAGMSVRRVHAEIVRLTEKARSRTLLLEEIRGGTFTVSNFGSFSGVFGNPMILPPQVGILGIGRVHEQPVVREGRIVPAALLPLSLVVDHRLIDGVYACKFLARFMELISKPLRLLML